MKGESKRSQATFVESEYHTKWSHYGFDFITKNVSDPFNFTITLVDGMCNKIIFPSNETKGPVIGFKIQIVKWSKWMKKVLNKLKNWLQIIFDTSDAYDRYLLYMQFVAWYCKGSSIVPLSDYAKNLTFQELPDWNDDFTNSDKKLIIDLRRGKAYTGQLEKINRVDRGR